MARKFWLGIEIALLGALQLFVISYSLVGVWQAHAETAAASTSAASPPAPLGSFLAQYPEGKSAKLAPRFGISQLGQGAFAGYRVIKEQKRAKAFADDNARHSFTSECTSLGGHIARFDNPGEVAHYFGIAKKLALDSSSPPLVCADAEELTLGALFGLGHTDRYGDRYSALFVLTQEVATEMVVIYHRGKAKELRFQADMAEKQAADEARWADWRAKLGIGSETHCGPVLDLKGPMVQVAYGTQAGWVRRERLFPPQDVLRCWEFSGL